jgi:2-succinyl-5-enolpyruvyl-6-hydroxy-3-cyclohexene-1-carboxylate synthase
MSASAQAAFCSTLVDEWVRAGIRQAVVAPGSRSTPMAMALADHPGLTVHVAHDERTAAFWALGVGIATGMPAVALCTSGTAATHFHAAVVEAHQAGVPLIVLTADRPPELHGVGAPQTIDQQQLYGTAVRWFHDPGVPDGSTSDTWRPLARHAMWLAGPPASGPVHLNLPFREPLLAAAPVAAVEPAPGGGDSDPPDLAAARTPHAADLDALVEMLDAARGVIVAGRGAGDGSGLAALSAATGWPVLADPRCPYPEGATGLVRAFDSLLRHQPFAVDHRPDVVLRVGELPASKVLGQWLAASGARQAHVIDRPAVIDPDGVVGQRVPGDPDAVCQALSQRLRGAMGTPWSTRWRRAEERAQATLDAMLRVETTLSEPGVARTLLQTLPEGAHLLVASSMPVRDLEWFGGARQGVTVHANRGANGIDGIVATGLGIAAATGAPTAVLLGDVALVHDSSSLVGLAGGDLDVRIVVVDNDGGGIFSFLPQADQLARDRFEQLFGTPHGTDLVALAHAHGLAAGDATTTADLAGHVTSSGPWLLRVRSDRAANVARHRQLNEAVARALTPG